jgi:cation transport regulator ChaB
MVNRRESLQEALRLWRAAEREHIESGDGREDLEANVRRLRDEYQRLYTEGMAANIDRLHEADDRRSRATPSTLDFHAATRDTEEIAADIWEQARRGDRDSPPTRTKVAAEVAAE